jgi:hypothetical protein
VADLTCEMLLSTTIFDVVVLSIGATLSLSCAETVLLTQIKQIRKLESWKAGKLESWKAGKFFHIIDLNVSCEKPNNDFNCSTTFSI